VVEVADSTVKLEIAPNVIVRYDRAQIGSLADSPQPKGGKA